MKILVLGNGWLGKEIAKFLGGDLFTGRLTVDTGELTDTLLLQYDWIVNCIAKTNIDWCEANKGETLEVNAIIAGNLAARCYDLKRQYAYISSACIFEPHGRTDIKYEDSQPNPKCFYALTKWVGEELVMEANPESLIVRIRLPISSEPHPRNTLNKLLNYPILNDAQESMTIIDDFLPAFRMLIEQKAQGVFHVVNEGTISPSEIGDMLEHEHTVVSKMSQDARMAKEGRAKRVTTYVGSLKIPLLPDIRKRMPEIISIFKEKFV